MASTTTEKAEKFVGSGFDSSTLYAAWGAWRELFAQQVKVSQSVLDQGMAFARKSTDVMAAQVAEGMKLQQEAWKVSATFAETGLGVADVVRKTAFETAEKYVK